MQQQQQQQQQQRHQRALAFPTWEEKQAWQLRTRQGLADGEIARLLGIARETANRRINRFERKLAALRLACVGGDCSLLEAVLN